ncbi:pantoate--beta-alanine ligase [Nocardioides acrostichi]|uniref:Pantothenate synthetase n=1 Tax=Nocardioides acrostichi TaxID=2784339 RepID=A0A930V0U6_9ACTN|nr:pantoate--beta-alanine ligase [Nocardioides acrostichi]MBF4162610.1 pantoate--beta-alanine ligase [Nocardioides acrostichi]
MSTPVLLTTRAELAEHLAGARRDGRRVGLVPTMGALHEGHASLMKCAREQVGEGPVVVSVFVNPTQFGEGEDLDRYPRTLEADLKVCEREGVDVVFAPSVEEMYPHGPGSAAAVMVRPGALAKVLEGRIRKGHFRGVLTVVAKLFGLVRPDVAVFGQKDFQQLALIRRMADDLCLGVDVVGAPTVREPDGLALSSRNAYLDPAQRRNATALSHALFAAQEEAQYGAQAALHAARGVIRSSPGISLEYLEITTADLAPLPDDAPRGFEARILIAARVGTTRLIDNLPLTLGTLGTATGGH